MLKVHDQQVEDPELWHNKNHINVDLKKLITQLYLKITKEPVVIHKSLWSSVSHFKIKLQNKLYKLQISQKTEFHAMFSKFI